MIKYVSVLSVVLILFFQSSYAQRIMDSTGRTVIAEPRGISTDSLNKIATPVRDKKVDSVLKTHSVRKAVIRSAIVPGLGQIYNKKYWKLPIVYGALGVTAYIFLNNIQEYRDLRFTYKAKYQASKPGATAADSVLYKQIKDEYLPYSLESLRQNRDQFRRYVDYSVLFFVFVECFSPGIVKSSK